MLKRFIFILIYHILKVFGFTPDFDDDWWAIIGNAILCIALIAFCVFVLWHFIKFMIVLWSILIEIIKKKK